MNYLPIDFCTGSVFKIILLRFRLFSGSRNNIFEMFSRNFCSAAVFSAIFLTGGDKHVITVKHVLTNEKKRRKKFSATVVRSGPLICWVASTHLINSDREKLYTVGWLTFSVWKLFVYCFSHFCSIWGSGKFKKHLLLKNTNIIDVRYEI